MHLYCVWSRILNVALLRRTIEANEIENATEVVQQAVAGKSGTANFELSRATNLNKLSDMNRGGGGRRSTEGCSTNKVVVQCLSLDDVFRNYGAFESLRMDVEGAEASIFSGACELFLAAMPKGSIIFMEAHPNTYIPDTEAMRVGLTKILASGFKQFGFVTSGVSPCKKIIESYGLPEESFREGGFIRYNYENVRFEFWREIATTTPKAIRYLYCLK